MKGLVYLFLALFVWAPVCRSQQTVTSATLVGEIEDRSTARVKGAVVTVKNVETNQEFTTSSDYDGRFKIPLLRVGRYSLHITAAGFDAFSEDLTLALAQTLDVSIKLDVLGFREVVNVNAEVPALETQRTQVAETIRPHEINELPLNGRNYLDLALLVPAVSPTNTGSNQRFAETSAVPGQGISVAGQRNLYNSFIVDGMSANDDAADLTGTYYSEEVIDQFQVVTSGGIAEFGRAAGGIINIITKSGTNKWQGSVYGYGRNQRFDARNPVATSKDFLTQAQYGSTLGGPLRSDRTFLFTNFEQTRRHYSAVLTMSPSAVAAINQRLGATNYQGPRLYTGVVPASFDTTNFLARVDHRINSRHQVTGRYNIYHITADNSRTVGGLNAVSRGSGLDNTDQSTQLNLISTLSKRTFNEARVQYTRSTLNAPINDPIGPAVNISGVANFGTATSSPLARDINLFEVTDSLSSQRGNHSFKGGIDILYNRVDVLFPGQVQGVYSFNSLHNFLSGNYNTFQQAFGVPEQKQSNPNIGFFGQDEWRIRRDLTINAGVRYDVQFLPQPIQNDLNNVAPRIGIAYAPGNRKTVVRAGFGLFYDRIPLRATSNALQRDGMKYVVSQFSPTQVGAAVFPQVLATQPAVTVTKPNITRIDPNIDASYSEQANIQVERELRGGATLSLGYLHVRTLHIIISRNVNVPTLPATAGQPNLGRPDPNWGNISRYESSGVSDYNGLVASFNQPLRTWSTLRISYTLSKAIDNAGNFFFSTVQNNFNIRDDRGLSDNDQRHRLVVSGSVEPPGKWKLGGVQFGYIFTYASRLPFNVLLGSDRNLDTNNNDRPVGVGRNTGRGFDFASLDLRLSRTFRLNERLQLLFSAEGFNILNRSNLSIPNNTFGPGMNPLPTFGQATAAFDPRQFQFGIKAIF